MAVVFVGDPDGFNVNKNLTNGIPQYQDMFIFAELTAYSKSRTVLETSNGGYLGGSTSNSDFVNFAGSDVFTTRWYDDDNESTLEEGFGITDIKVKTDSSYIPQVNIKFVDVRGMSFFNDANSPYRVIFNFPPPLFELKLKGYYGKTISYKLHLTKYTTEFLADSGKFVIDANFVAVTFAPLADIPLRYVAQFGFINSENIQSNPDKTKAPKNTLDLIDKIGSIYGNLKELTDGSLEKDSIDTKNEDLIKIQDGLDYIQSIKTLDSLKTSNPNFAIVNRLDINRSNSTNNGTGTDNVSNPTIKIIGYTYEYNQIINNVIPNSTSISTDESRLYLVLEPIPYLMNSKEEAVSVDPKFSSDILMNNNITIAINDIKEKMKAFSAYSINSNDIKVDVTPTFKIINPHITIGKLGENIGDFEVKRYYYIDLTDFHKGLYLEYMAKGNSRNMLISDLNDKINDKIFDGLGMNPTIYNIFDVILRDVDWFFKVLLHTAKKSEDEHNKPEIIQKLKNKSAIFKDNVDLNKVYAFPLVTNLENNVEKRTLPIALANELGVGKFPEIALVEDFIKSFYIYNNKKKINDLKNQKSTEGNSLWLPFSPREISPNGDISNPYSEVFGIKDILGTMISRYYIVRQNILGNNQTTKTIIDFYSNADAINIVNSLGKNEVLLGNIKTNADKFGASDGYNSFKEYVKTDAPTSIYNLDGENLDKLYLNYSSLSNDMIINKKNDPDFRGIGEINLNPIVERFDTKDKKDPVNIFINDHNLNSIFNNNIYKDINNFKYKYTNDNSIFIDDINKEGSYNTMYISNEIIDMVSSSDITTTSNLDFSNKDGSFISGNIAETWIKWISNEKIINIISDVGNNYEMNKDADITKLLILSNFGATMSPFNMYPTRLNKFVFNMPAIISMPIFVPAYIGLLVTLTDDSNIINLNHNIIDVLKTGALSGENFNINIFNDMNDIKKYLSNNDKVTFVKAYENFINQNYEVLINEIHNLILKNNDRIKNSPWILHNDYGNPNIKKEFNDIFKDVGALLLKKINLYNFTSLTFYMSNEELHYESTLKKNDETDSFYFTTLFKKLSSLVTKVKETIKTVDNSDTTSDIDIMTQTYYSFKNINDKWLAGNVNGTGYPFNVNGGKLIDQFAFVDRAMNDIGDTTMINPSVLVDMFTNTPNISVFTALTTLLSINGFEFFPLQNFIKSNDQKSWEDSFKINTSGEIDAQPMFICMYVGGTSSYPSGIVNKNGFNDDCIIDLDNKNGTADFNVLPKNASKPWLSTVKAFKVKFGKQGQSMFSDIKVDSKEYPETNESIQILSKLAGDEKQETGIPKGQNLYNLYENRSYKATVTGLGNVSLQPTQYFQLENVPLYNGAYIILTVEHTITPNIMNTSFSGTKILRYPIPRVTQPSAVFGIDIGASTSTNPNTPPLKPVELKTVDGEINTDVNHVNDIIDIPSNMRFNSMYTYSMDTTAGLTDTAIAFIDSIFKMYGEAETTLVKYTNIGKGITNTYETRRLYHTDLPFGTYDFISSKYPTNGDWKTAMKKYVIQYSKMYSVDPNVVVALLYNESAFISWGFSETGCFGVAQFASGTLFDFTLKSRNSDSDPSFTDEEIARLTFNIKGDKKILHTYENTNTTSGREDWTQFYRNAVENPDLIIKASCRYLNFINQKSGNLLSSTLYGYNQGDSHAKKDYISTYNSGGNREDGSKYVYKIMKLLSSFGDPKYKNQYTSPLADIRENRSFTTATDAKRTYKGE